MFKERQMRATVRSMQCAERGLPIGLVDSTVKLVLLFENGGRGVGLRAVTRGVI